MLITFFIRFYPRHFPRSSNYGVVWLITLASFLLYLQILSRVGNRSSEGRWQTFSRMQNQFDFPSLVFSIFDRSSFACNVNSRHGWLCLHCANYVHRSETQTLKKKKKMHISVLWQRLYLWNNIHFNDRWYSFYFIFNWKCMIYVCMMYVYICMYVCMMYVFIFMKSMKIDFYFVKSRTYFMNYVWQNLKYFFF